MTDLSDAFAAQWQRRLRLPAWRPLVVSLCVIGAIAILFATNHHITNRETARFEAAARADTAALAAALAEDAARAVPLAAYVAEDLLPLALNADDAESRARVSARLAAFAEGATAAGVLLRLPGRDGAPTRSFRAGAEATHSGLDEFAAEAAQGGRVLQVMASPTGSSGSTGSMGPPAPMLFAAAMLPGADAFAASPIAVVVLRPNAFETAASGMSGAVGIMAEGTVEASLSDLALRTTAPVDPLDVVVAITRSTEPVRAAVREALSIEVMVMTLLAAIAMFMDSRRTHRAYSELSSDAAALRDLNDRLSAEVEERRRVEAELREAEAGLKEASKLAALGQMSAAISHELSQPVAALRTYLAGLRLLVRQQRREEAEETVDSVERIVERMTGITRELKALARGRRGGEAEPPAPTDLTAAARAAAEGIMPLMRQHNIALEIVAPEKPVLVRAAPHRLEQVFSNLIQNAHDAVEQLATGTRRVEIAIEETDGLARAEVVDSGLGLPKGMAAQVFEPFFTTKRQGEGLGLGLAISRSIAVDLGGLLEPAARRRAGPCRGARFLLSLPSAAAEEKDATPAEAVPA
ncbi:MAG: ATP-binding protein [Pseudomonadota bacterium]